MKPRLIRVGKAQAPVVIVDEASGDAAQIVDVAAQLAPFPVLKNNYYPGVRRLIGEGDSAANAYVTTLCERIAPFIAGAFDCDGFDLVEASFSMVTTPPRALAPPQRAPHFDSTDPRYLAVLHYLHVAPGTGTAFFRQRQTGIEQITERNIASFITTAERDAAMLGSSAGYIGGSNPFFEQLERVEAVSDRLLIYQGSLLHSGIIPPAMELSHDPRRGRLTANLFVRAH